jgi:hypothetical protein
MHFDCCPLPKVPPAQPPQNVVSITRVWLKNLSPKEEEQGPEKVVLGKPNVDGSGWDDDWIYESGDERDSGIDVGGKNQMLMTESVHSIA